MIKQSLRPTPMVFTYRALFIATFTLKCRLHIKIWNLFYLILQLTKQNLFTFCLWAFTLTCSIIPTKELQWYQENFLCWNTACMGTFYRLFENIIFQFHPNHPFPWGKLDISSIKKNVQFSLLHRIFCQCNYHSNLVCNTTNLSVLSNESQCKDWKWASRDNLAWINRNAYTFDYKFLNPFQKHKTEHKRKLNSLKLSMVLFQLNLKSSNKHKINIDE